MVPPGTYCIVSWNYKERGTTKINLPIVDDHKLDIAKKRLVEISIAISSSCKNDVPGQTLCPIDRQLH